MKYSRSLDLILAALKSVSAGKPKIAGLALQKAMAQKDFKPTIAALELQQAAAFDVAREASPSLSAMFETLAAKAKAKKKVKAKGKPFGGKQAPPFKKKVKAADESEDDEDMEEDEEGDDEETSDTTMTGTDPSDLEPVLREMTMAEDLEGDEGFGNNDDDLTLEDLEGIEEMPEASLEDEGLEDLDLEDNEFEVTSEEDEGDDTLNPIDEEDVMAKKTLARRSALASAKKARVKVVSSNLDALDRLRLSVSGKSASK